MSLLLLIIHKAEVCEYRGVILSHLYDKNQLEPKLIDRLKWQQKNRAPLRAQNFIGQMLRHHSMKSTQYMAQWIEAKNRLNHNDN